MATTKTKTTKKKMSKKAIAEQFGPIMKDGKLVGYKTNLPFPNSLFRITQYGTMMCPDPTTCYVFDEVGKAIATGSDREILSYLSQMAAINAAAK